MRKQANPICCLCLLMSLTMIAGCGRKTHTKPTITVTEAFESHDVSPTDLTLSTEEVSQHLAESQNWKKCELKEVGVGQYEGPAITADGQKLTVEVRQTSSGIYARWTIATGGTGEGLITW